MYFHGRNMPGCYGEFDHAHGTKGWLISGPGGHVQKARIHQTRPGQRPSWMFGRREGGQQITEATLTKMNGTTFKSNSCRSTMNVNVVCRHQL